MQFVEVELCGNSLQMWFFENKIQEDMWNEKLLAKFSYIYPIERPNAL
jgi:hypothetical protein